MKNNIPSVTALVVACVLLIVGGDEYGRSLLPPGCLDAQIAVLQAANYLIGKIPWILSNPILSKFVRLIQPNKGIAGIAFRKCWIEGQLVQAVVKQGVSQVLILGAGFCTMAYRLAPKYKHATFWEIDHPATWAVKRNALQSLGIPNNLRTLPVDLSVCSLSEKLPDLLDYDPTKPTVVIMEGLLMYLSESNIKALLADIDAITGPGTVIAFDFLVTNDKGEVSHGRFTKFASWLVKSWGERYRWAIKPNDLPEFLASTPWKLCNENIAVAGYERLAALQKKES